MYWIADACVSNPSDQIVEVLMRCMEWNLMTSQQSIPESELPVVTEWCIRRLWISWNCSRRICQTSVVRHQAGTSKREHSILHKVSEIVLWSNSDNTSCQGAEHAHIELIK